jgi:plastocyanin
MKAFRMLGLGLGLSLVVGVAGADAKTVRIRIADMAFQPAEVEVSVGDVVEWQNDDFVDHTVTSGSGGFDIAIPSGKAATATIEHDGSFPYLCRYHPTMRGDLVAR